MDQHTNSKFSHSNSQDKLFHRSESIPNVTKRIVEMLDLIEHRVELLRDAAAGIEAEKDTLVTMLKSISGNKDLSLASEGEREEIELTTQRLLSRTLTVEVTVQTPRNELQQKALDNVNKHLEELVVAVEVAKTTAKSTVQCYLNACSSEYLGPVHQKFQAAVIECTADDQKQIKKRLENLMNSL